MPCALWRVPSEGTWTSRNSLSAFVIDAPAHHTANHTVTKASISTHLAINSVKTHARTAPKCVNSQRSGISTVFRRTSTDAPRGGTNGQSPPEVDSPGPLGGMQPDFSMPSHNFLLTVGLVVLRAVAKVPGAVTGATLSRASSKVRRLVAGGLISQGGIVAGPAWLMRQKPGFSGIFNVIVSVVIGPIASKIAIRAAGEIQRTPSRAQRRNPH